MSFLTILLFSSAFYFAQARPDSSPPLGSEDYPDIPAEIPKDFPKEKEPLEDDFYRVDFTQYRDKLNNFMVTMTEASDDWLKPMIASLDEEKQKEIKQMEYNTYASCINYMLLLIENEVNSKPGVKKNYQDDIVISYEGNDEVDAAAYYIAKQH